MRSNIREITGFWRFKKVRMAALMKRITKPENIGKVVKIQSCLRGHLVRAANWTKIEKIRRDAPKKTKKYQLISKLQANIKGFLFRQRRRRLLAKVAARGPNTKSSINLKR